MNDAPSPQLRAMVCKYQCPGCAYGDDTECGEFEVADNGMSCGSHLMGTFVVPIGPIALGFPKGFCRPGYDQERQPNSRMSIRLWPLGTAPEWDHLNVAVWAMEEDGALFVRTALPRVAAWITDVIEGGTLALCPEARDVSKFIDQID